MKRLLTILLFFTMFVVFGQQTQVQISQYQEKNKLMEYLLQNAKQEINLTQGIDVEAITKKKPFDYNNFVISTKEYSYYHPQISSDNNFIAGNFENYYQLDFAADPFDGRIQILVVGEPLPSPVVTLFCSLGVVGILLYCRKKKEIKV